MSAAPGRSQASSHRSPKGEGTPVSGIRIMAVLHPWPSGPDEHRQLAAAAAALAQGGELEVLRFTGQTHPSAIADELMQRLSQPPHATQRLLVLLPTGTESEDIAAQVATGLGGNSLGRCGTLDVTGGSVNATRAAFGGRVTLTLGSDARVTCATLRPESIDSADGAVPATVEVAMNAATAFESKAEPGETGRPRVEGASIVVAGGRGMAGQEGFEWLARIASTLGAGLGGSLPAVDAGWVPVAHQVGQSGKFVAPRAYFAVAISGTPQHLAGIAPGTRILALNNDPSASIFSRCDVAVEGDWREILPLLALELERSASSR